MSQPEFTEQFKDGTGVRNTALEPLLALGDLVAAPVGSDRVEDILRGLPHIAVGVIRGAEAASLTLIGADGAPTTPVFTSVLAQGMDAIQYQAKEGPCLEAATAEQPGDEDRTRNVPDAALSPLAGPSDRDRTVAAPRQRSRRSEA